MKKRRSRRKLEKIIILAKSDDARARAYYSLGLFHDNNAREAEAIPNYEQAIALGLDQLTEAKALAWLASSLYKTGKPQGALQKLKQSQEIAVDKKLKSFLRGLEKRITKVY